MTIAVKFDAVSRHFGSVRAVDAVDLEIGEGEFFAMLGPSGSGKTTCLRLIAGFEQPTSGHIEIFGERAEGVPPYRRNVNTVFQDYALVPELTAQENVYLPSMVRGMTPHECTLVCSEILGVVGLGDRIHHLPGEMSGGEQQRVAIARALVNKPTILLADEPCANLDSQNSRVILDLFKKLNKNLHQTIVMVSHEEWHKSYFDRIIYMKDGVIEQQ